MRRTLHQKKNSLPYGGKGETMKTLTLMLLSFACLCLAVSAIVAQDIETRGSIKGEVKDKNGAAIV